MRRDNTIPPGHLSVAQMMRMGFTPRIIWNLLGPPHTSTTTEPFPKWPQHHFYRTEDVENLTLTMEFQITRLWETLKFAHTWKRQNSKLDETLLWAETVPIVTHFPQRSLDQIILTAALDRSSWSNYSNAIYTPDQSPRDVLETWAYTYLKHKCTNYDDLCQHLRDHEFGRYVYPTLLHRVNVLILDQYPFTIRLRGDNGSPVKTCRKCGRKERGQYNGHYWTKPTHWYTRARARNNASNAIHTYCSRACAMPQPPKPIRVRQSNQDQHPWTTPPSPASS